VLEDASVKTVLLEFRVINIIKVEEWRALIMTYLCHYYELDSKNEQIRMQQWAKGYQIVGNELYRTSMSGPLLCCISKIEGQEILQEVHVGICGGHIGACALAAKVLRQGFYWPAIIDDATKLATTYEACQKFSHRCKAPAQPSQLIAPSWPLQRWGIDIVGKLTPAQGNYTFAIVAVEYFTKWVEAKPVTSIISTTIQKFFWQNIICHYGVPQQITVDNAKYLDSAMFKDFCHQVRMKVSFAFVYHPQSNGAAKWANTLIFESIKKILEGEKKGKWAKVMPGAVWSHNTTVCRATNFTLFQLLFRAEAGLLEEIKHQSLCTIAEAPPCPNEA
jgi:hypothetical protein